MERRIRRLELEEVKDWRAVRKVGMSDGIGWSAGGVDMVVRYENSSSRSPKSKTSSALTVFARFALMCG